MSHKTAADAAAVALAVVVLTLGVRANDARAEAAELTDAQMDHIVAGAWAQAGGVTGFDMLDLFSTYYTYNAQTNTFQDSRGDLWALESAVHFWANGTVYGLLRNAISGAIWDGGIQAPAGPQVQPMSTEKQMSARKRRPSRRSGNRL